MGYKHALTFVDARQTDAALNRDQGPALRVTQPELAERVHVWLTTLYCQDIDPGFINETLISRSLSVFTPCSSVMTMVMAPSVTNFCEQDMAKIEP